MTIQFLPAAYEWRHSEMFDSATPLTLFVDFCRQVHFQTFQCSVYDKVGGGPSYLENHITCLFEKLPFSSKITIFDENSHQINKKNI